MTLSAWQIWNIINKIHVFSFYDQFNVFLNSESQIWCEGDLTWLRIALLWSVEMHRAKPQIPAIFFFGNERYQQRKKTSAQVKDKIQSCSIEIPCRSCEKQSHWNVGAGTPVCLATVSEYSVAELLELEGSTAHNNQKRRINTNHLWFAICDE